MSTVLRLQNGQWNILVPQFEVISVLYRFEFIAANAVQSKNVVLSCFLLFSMSPQDEKKNYTEVRLKKNVQKKNT